MFWNSKNIFKFLRGSHFHKSQIIFRCRDPNRPITEPNRTIHGQFRRQTLKMVRVRSIETQTTQKGSLFVNLYPQSKKLTVYGLITVHFERLGHIWLIPTSTFKNGLCLVRRRFILSVSRALSIKYGLF